jgi:hypothetical protein
MTDVLMLVIMVAFFALAVLFVRGCERIIGPDVDAGRAETETVTEQPAA